MTVIKGFQQTVTKVVPTKRKRENHLSLLLFNKSVLEQFWKECGDSAKSSEFQVHYRGITILLKKDNMEFSIIIPTACYNFKQEVSSAAVSWDGSDATNASESVKKISSLKVDELLQKMPILSAISGLGEYSIIESDVGTLHRHPSRFGFSATDYDINPENPGVIFRKRGSQEFIQNDCVMYFNGKDSEIYCSETRISNTEVVENGIRGCYEEATTYCMILKDSSKKEKGFGDILGDIVCDVFDNYEIRSTNTANKIVKYPIIQKILEDYRICEYSPDVSKVNGSLITQMCATVGYAQSYGANHYNRTVNKVGAGNTGFTARYCPIEKRFLTATEWEAREQKERAALLKDSPSCTTEQSRLESEEDEYYNNWCNEYDEENLLGQDSEVEMPSSTSTRKTEEEMIEDYYNNYGMLH